MQCPAKPVGVKVGKRKPESVNSRESSSELKLTEFASGLGCACKLRPQALEEVLGKVKYGIHDSKLLVGNETADDAAVIRIRDDLALVHTTDFFPPLVDDPYEFGQISAANALSDVYAMGAVPVSAISIVGFPADSLPLEVLSRILQGAEDKVEECGIVIAGGHTIEDAEPKFGLSVVGSVHPEKIFRNVGAHERDVLILTKPLGTGVITTSYKRGLCGKDTLGVAVKTMVQLQKQAMDVILGNEKYSSSVHAVTDVTGFGLLGHVTEMAVGGQVVMEITDELVPRIQEAVRLCEMFKSDVLAGGTLNNMLHVSDRVRVTSSVLSTPEGGVLLADAQTSGGLLLSVDEKVALDLVHDLRKNGCESASPIGIVRARSDDDAICVRVSSDVDTETKSWRKLLPNVMENEPKEEVKMREGQIVCVTNDVLGGDGDLGKMLMKGMLQKLLTNEEAMPESILFINRAVFITTNRNGEWSDVIEALRQAEEKGMKVISCITCLNFYDINAEESMEVGLVGTADDTVNSLLGSDNFITIG